jgi:hypothetical protein
VLIVGSCKRSLTPAELRTFSVACKSLGRKLAEGGFTIIAGSSNEKTADYCVIAGANESGVRANVILLRPTLVEEGEQIEPILSNLDVDRKFVTGKWKHVRERQVAAADVILVIGGGRGTNQVIDVALARRKPIIPIGAYSGSVRTRWSDFATTFRKHGIDDDTQLDLKDSFDVAVVMKVLDKIAPKAVSQPEEPRETAGPDAAAGRRDKKRKVFVSHSSKDKPFVRRIVKELEKHKLEVWFDERAMGVGDSIVSGIDTGLKNADYLLVVLSRNSVKSRWVRAELNAALFEEASKQGMAVLPAVIDDCEIPILLRDRIYADFRESFANGLKRLLRVFEQEGESAQSSEPSHRPDFAASGCQSALSSIKLAELRRRMSKRMSRAEVSTVWFDVVETKMDNDMQGRTLVECVISLLDWARNRKRLADVIDSVCAERADLATPD